MECFQVLLCDMAQLVKTFLVDFLEILQDFIYCMGDWFFGCVDCEE